MKARLLTGCRLTRAIVFPLLAVTFSSSTVRADDEKISKQLAKLDAEFVKALGDTGGGGGGGGGGFHPLDIAVIDMSDKNGPPNLAAVQDWYKSSSNNHYIFARKYAGIIGVFAGEGPTWANVLQQFPARGECIRHVEVMGHGSPWNLAGITSLNVNRVAAILANVTWCGYCDIYLKGCATGLRNSPNYQVSQVTIADTLARALPYCTIYGTRGEALPGHTYFAGNMQVIKNDFINSVNASGAGSWNVFNGSAAPVAGGPPP